jgi:hypothetical protein
MGVTYCRRVDGEESEEQEKDSVDQRGEYAMWRFLRFDWVS